MRMNKGVVTKTILDAKKAALAQLNKDRSEIGMSALNRVPMLWWSIHGDEWIAKIVAGDQK